MVLVEGTLLYKAERAIKLNALRLARMARET